MKQIEEEQTIMQDSKSMRGAVKDFTDELMLTINSSGVTTGDIAFGVANLVVRKVKPSLKKILSK